MADELVIMLIKSNYNANARSKDPKEVEDLAKDIHQDLIENHILNINLSDIVQRLVSHHQAVYAQNNSNNNNNNNNNFNNEILGNEYDKEILVVRNNGVDHEGSNLL